MESATGMAPGSPSEHAIHELIDRQQIHDVLVRYCRGIDRLDRDLIETVYHPDAVDTRSIEFTGAEAGEKLTALVASRSDRSLHYIANEHIELAGDVAYGETYLLGLLVKLVEGTEQVSIVYGRYVDRFERRGGEWRIARRVVIPDWSDAGPARPVKPPVTTVVSSRSRDDISYDRAEAD